MRRSKKKAELKRLLCWGNCLLKTTNREIRCVFSKVSLDTKKTLLSLTLSHFKDDIGYDHALLLLSQESTSHLSLDSRRTGRQNPAVFRGVSFCSVFSFQHECLLSSRVLGKDHMDSGSFFQRNVSEEGSLQRLLSSADLEAQDQLGMPTTSVTQHNVVDSSVLNRLMQEHPLQQQQQQQQQQRNSSLVDTEKDLDKLLLDIWDRQTVKEEGDGGYAQQKGTKRKLSDMAADSTNCPENEPTSLALVSTTNGGMVQQEGKTETSPPRSKLSRDNVLLSKLLNETPTTKEHSVNTQHTVTPVTAVPQARLPKDLSSKVVTMRENNNNVTTHSKQLDSPKTLVGVDVNLGSASGRLGGNFKVSMEKWPTAWDNPRTNPNAPYPGNTKDLLGAAAALPKLGDLQGATGIVVTTSGVSPAMTALPSAPTQQQILSGLSATSATAVSSVTSSTDFTGGDPDADPDLTQILQVAENMQNSFGSAAAPTRPFDQQTNDNDDISHALDAVSTCNLIVCVVCCFLSRTVRNKGK